MQKKQAIKKKKKKKINIVEKVWKKISKELSKKKKLPICLALKRRLNKEFNELIFERYNYTNRLKEIENHKK